MADPMQSARPLQCTCAAVLALVMASTGALGLSIDNVIRSAGQVGRYGPWEVKFSLSESYSNPYDPDQVEVTFDFTGPSGVTRTIPAFWISQWPGWCARIVPLETGPHTCMIRARKADGQLATRAVDFHAVASSARGFLRIDSRNPRYLRYDNGDPYLPVGHNLCWHGGNSLFTTWLNNMAAQSMNWARYWMVPFVGQGIEWGPGTDGQLGTYSQSQSALFDSMFEAARVRGIAVQLAMDSFNGWNVAVWPNWHENPYNAANGGMLGTPVEYFTHPLARKLARQRFRYIVARWAYNPTILCWEFFNEVDAFGAGTSESFWGHVSQCAAWHAEMAQYIRSIDPFEHLRTTSFADDGPRSSYNQIWALPEMDIVQVHDYHWNYPAHQMNLIRDARQHGKPVIMGEGDDAGTPDQLDPGGQSLHDLIWAAAVIESGAMSWWWDNWIHPRNLYPIFGPLTAYLAGEDWAPQQLAPLSASILSGHTLQLYGSAGPLHAYVFVREPNRGAVANLQLFINGMSPVDYQVEFWNTYTGAVISAPAVAGSQGGLLLNVPDFTADVAIKIRAMVPLLAVTPAQLTPAAIVGQDAPPDTFTVANAGYGAVNYAITTDAAWLTTLPTNGSVTGTSDTITVFYDIPSLHAGQYTATITVSDPEAYNSPGTVEVALTISAFPGDLDGDGDRDQSDFGILQACLGAPGMVPDNPACVAADLDRDTDVDQTDAALLRSCLTGAGVQADPDCLH
jgi:hypothetical protein